MVPHPPLTSHYASTEGKPAFVNGLFDAGASHYDSVVNWGFLRSGASYRRRTLRQHGLKPGDHLLDVACGTGLVAAPATKKMLSLAGIKDGEKEGGRDEWLCGGVSRSLPLTAASLLRPAAVYTSTRGHSLTQ